MEAVPLALSVSHFINSVGADAGFAAFIGLALLVVLYFAQARETHLLRTQAADAEDRVTALEASVSALNRAQPTVAPRASGAPSSIAPAPAHRLVAAAAVSPVGMAAGVHASPPALTSPGAPAGVGAPALTDATRLIPVQGNGPVPDARAGPPVAATPGSDQAPAGIAADSVSRWGPAPATAAAASVNGVARDPVAPTPAPGGPAPRVALRPSGSAGPSGGAGRGRGSASAQPSRSRRRILGVLAALLVIAAVAVALIVTSSGGAPGKTSATTTAAQRNRPLNTRRPKTPVVNPALVTVAVLNGTPTPNLAHAIGSRLAAVGYKEGNIVTASDQTQTSTAVGYLPGHRNDGLAVATSLKLHASSVIPANQSTESVACPPPAPCPATVIVTVGSDLAAGA